MRMRTLTLFIPLALILFCGMAFSKGRKYKKQAQAHYYGEQVVRVPPGQIVRSCRVAPRVMRGPKRFKIKQGHPFVVPGYRAVPAGVIHYHRGGYGGIHHHPYPPPRPRRSGVRGYIGINVGIGIGF
jgi:hypothetical protein